MITDDQIDEPRSLVRRPLRPAGRFSPNGPAILSQPAEGSPTPMAPAARPAINVSGAGSPLRIPPSGAAGFAARRPTPTPLPTTAPALPTATGQTAFGPGNDLRATQIDPVASGRLAGARSATDAAGQGVQGFNYGASALTNSDTVQRRLAQGPVAFRGVDPTVTAGANQTDVTRRAVNPTVGFQGVQTQVAGGPAVAPSTSLRLGQVGRLVDAESQKLANVDRFQLAKDKVDQFTAANDPEYERANRIATQRAAAGGKLASGMLRTDYGNLDLARARDLDTFKKGVLTDALEGTIGDQFNKTNTLAGLEGQIYGQDAGFRGEQRTERDYSTGLGERNVGRATGERDTALGLAERNTGRDLSLAGEESALGERNLGRRSDERAFATGLSERNYGRSASERDASLGLDLSNRDYEGKIRRDAISMGLGLTGQEAGYGMDRFNAARTGETDAYNQDVGGRQELRGERDYQTRSADKAMADALAERQQQEREMAQRASLLLGGSQAAGQSSSEDMNALQQAIAAFMARRKGEGSQ